MNSPERIYRHPLPVRIWHWVNAACFFVLLLSGFQIFNAHPRLYWGHTGYSDELIDPVSGRKAEAPTFSGTMGRGMPAVFEITGVPDVENPKSWVRIGSAKIPTTHILGVAEETESGVRNMAFPSWLRLPLRDHLGIGRGWHFLAAWILFFSIASYVVYIAAGARLWRVLLPEREQIRARAILKDLWMHVRLKHATGREALRYNLLQKLSYLLVLFGLIPLMIATGMTMSNSAVAAFPWLIDLFNGRQTARTIHFIGAISLLLFVLIHFFQLFVAGFGREMRSIITGYYAVPREKSE